jgi:hypothetical protein
MAERCPFGTGAQLGVRSEIVPHDVRADWGNIGMEAFMEKMQEKQRIVVKANPAYRGVVETATEDGQSGYVLIDDAPEESRRVHFHVSEIESEDAIVAKKVGATVAEQSPSRPSRR